MNLIKTLRPLRLSIKRLDRVLSMLDKKSVAISDRLDSVQPSAIGNRAWSRADRFHDRLETLLISVEADKQALEELLEEFREDAKQSKSGV